MGLKIVGNHITSNVFVNNIDPFNFRYDPGYKFPATVRVGGVDINFDGGVASLFYCEEFDECGEKIRDGYVMNQVTVSGLTIRDLPVGINLGKWWMQLGGAIAFYYQHKTAIDLTVKNHAFRNGAGDFVATNVCKANNPWFASIPNPPYQY